MDDLDLALERFQQCGLEYGGGLSNHGPMAAEALAALGHGALIPALVDVYAPRLRPFEPGAALAPSVQRSALGRADRAADWIATFEAELAGADWRSVLARWLPELLPGLFAAAIHGPIRTAHAVRALGGRENEVRRRELAFGLGYWASHHQALPGDPAASPRPGRGPAQVLRAVPLLPESRRRPGLLSEAVAALEGEAGFAACLASVDPGSSPLESFLSELCATAAELYLLHPEQRIVYAHCVTGASALRLLAPHLEGADRERAAGHALQAVAALHATHGRVPPSGAPGFDAAGLDDEVRAVAGSCDEVRYRAACSVEEHAIKLSEACLREDAIHPDPRLRLAAADAALRMGHSHGGRGG